MTRLTKMVDGVAIPLTDEELAEYEARVSEWEAGSTDRQWNEIRTQRNAKLMESDWTQLPDAPVDAAAWAEYRQALRDVTDQTDPFNIVWPTAPGA